MAHIQQEASHEEGLFPIEGSWLHADVPEELAETLSHEYDPDDRSRLAQAAADAALGEIRDAYITPHVRHAARKAAQIALGLKPLPGKQQGEQ